MLSGLLTVLGGGAAYAAVEPDQHLYVGSRLVGTVTTVGAG